MNALNAPDNEVPTAVYAHYDFEGVCLYVGMTNDPVRRLAEHNARSRWSGQIDHVSVEWLADRGAATLKESEYIKSLKPIFNGGHSRCRLPTGDAFQDWLTASGKVQKDVAEAAGLQQPSISKFLSGRNTASLAFAVLVEDMSEGDVPVRYWLDRAAAQGDTQ